MGLIKTAMMSGTALYGINKISKSYEAHENARAGSRPASQDRYINDGYTRDAYNRSSYDDEYYREMEAVRQRYQNRQLSAPGQDTRSRSPGERALPQHPVDSKRGTSSEYYSNNDNQQYSRAPQYQDGYEYQERDHWRSESAPPYEDHRPQQRQMGYIEGEVGQGSGRSGNMLDSVLSMASQSDFGGSGKKGKGSLGAALSGRQ